MSINFDRAIHAMELSDFEYLKTVALNTIPFEEDDIVGEKWIRHAIDCASPCVVDWMLQGLKQHQINVKFTDGHNLVTACLDRENEGKESILNCLIQHSADINLPGWQGMPPIIYALFVKDYESLKLLLNNGADRNVKNEIDKNETFFELVANLDVMTRKYLGLD